MPDADPRHVLPTAPEPATEPATDAPADPATDPSARAALDAWRSAYIGRLAAPDGWWATCALHWLDDGVTRAGAANDVDLALPAPWPAHSTTFRVNDGRVTVEPVAPDTLWSRGGPVATPVVVDDADRTFALGPAPDAPRFRVLVRGARRGVRVYDPARAASRDPHADVAWYPVEPGWVVPARFEPATADETVPVVTLQGDVLETPSAGRLRFGLHGEDHALLATWAGDALFVMLRDAGSGAETYGAGRYLSVAAPVDGTTWIDFHRLHHPPCAHSPFATCPLPPLENRLSFLVRAGERAP